MVMGWVGLARSVAADQFIYLNPVNQKVWGMMQESAYLTPLLDDVAHQF